MRYVKRAAPCLSIMKATIVAALNRFVKVLYVAGPVSSNGRGANWPKFLQGRQTLADELAFLGTIEWATIWQKLIPAYIHTMGKLPPSVETRSATLSSLSVSLARDTTGGRSKTSPLSFG